MVFSKYMFLLFVILILTYQINSTNVRRNNIRSDPRYDSLPLCRDPQPSYAEMYNYEFQSRILRMISDAREDQRREFLRLNNEINKTNRMIRNITSSIERCEKMTLRPTVAYRYWQKN